MSLDAASFEKVPQTPTLDRPDPNQSLTQASPSNAHPSSEANHLQLFHRVPPVIASIFLFGSIGIVSVQRLEDLLAPGKDNEWNDFRNAVVTRVNNINVIASLFITGAAVFLSAPSSDPDLANWGNNVCFYAFGGTIGVAMLAVSAGCIISYIFMDLRAADLRSGQRSRGIKIALVLLFLWTHTFLVLADLALVLLAIFAAVLNGKSVWMRIGVGFVASGLVLQLLVAFVFVLMVRKHNP
ncbi:hypothetical protein FRB95_014821 [Tulasnella sp. JGI-2019a]|nr:hypothetical protein FRB93_006917 [Tulasnella sp. JGI-2019a]KAG9022416.1 hypothetical protein FRB95_014821 [Tulasnella sp. JGI-2019a]